MEADNFKEYVNNLKLELVTNREIVFFCIGTDRVIGDCLGPITGSLLKNKYNTENVYGDLEENLTYENIEKKLDEINLKFESPYIVAIDAALSEERNIGKFFVDNNGINFGNGLGKNVSKVGNLGIKVVVGKDYNDKDLNFRTLQNVSLSKIMKLSKKTFDGIDIILNK